MAICKHLLKSLNLEKLSPRKANLKLHFSTLKRTLVVMHLLSKSFFNLFLTVVLVTPTLLAISLKVVLGFSNKHLTILRSTLSNMDK